MSRRIMLPHVTRLDELFESWTRDKSNAPPAARWTGATLNFSKPSKKPPLETCDIGPYCSLDHEPLYVRPTPTALGAIREGTTHCGNRDSITFEIIRRADGALVIARHSLIIGGVWIALLPLEALEALK